MKDSDKKILIVILGIAILGLTFMYVIKPAREDIASLKTEIAALQAKYDDLKAKEANREQLLAETEQYNKEFEAELTNYPADLNQETTIMFLKGIEEQYEFINKAVSLPRSDEFYVLGQGASSSDAMVLEDGTEAEPYKCLTGAYSVTYQGTYDSIKEYMDYIANYKYRLSISSITISYDPETKFTTGNLTLNMYAISGPNRTPETVDVDVPNGHENIFVGKGGATASSDKYAANNGAAIATSHNVVMLLNNANNDATSGIIVACDENDENTYVTSSDNSSTALKISVYAADGKNFVSYEIGNATYEKEILTDDVTVYVKSSARVDSEDKNAVEVTVSNTTTLPVYFKVDGDDTVSPRFKVVNKSGSVKVY